LRRGSVKLYPVLYQQSVQYHAYSVYIWIISDSTTTKQRFS